MKYWIPENIVVKLKEAICGEDGRESKYEYRIASTKFLPETTGDFTICFMRHSSMVRHIFLKSSILR